MRNILAVSLCCIGAFAAVDASAANVTQHFAARVTLMQNSTDVADPVAVDQIVTGSITYNDAAPDADPGEIGWQYAASDIRLNLGAASGGATGDIWQGNDILLARLGAWGNGDWLRATTGYSPLSLLGAQQPASCQVSNDCTLFSGTAIDFYDEYRTNSLGDQTTIIPGGFLTSQMPVSGVLQSSATSLFSFDTVYNFYSESQPGFGFTPEGPTTGVYTHSLGLGGLVAGMRVKGEIIALSDVPLNPASFEVPGEVPLATSGAALLAYGFGRRRRQQAAIA